LQALKSPLLPEAAPAEIGRELAESLPIRRSHATVLTGVRRSGKSTLQRQLMRREGPSLYCNLEDTRLFGMAPPDFPTFLSLVDELAPLTQPVFLDEVQAVDGWQGLVRALVDGGRPVCLTGSNASLLGRELGAKLTGRHLSFAVFPFSYREYRAYTGTDPGADSFRAYLADGGFPVFLRKRDDVVLQQLLWDVVQRDVAARHHLRETRHLMNVLLFLLANTGQPFSFQRLTKRLAVPSVAQTSRFLEFLEDSYLLFGVRKFSPSFGQRVAAPAKYYAIDNGLCRANSPQLQPDLGHRLENAVALHLRRLGVDFQYAGQRDLWECDFVTPDEAIQVSVDLTPMNRRRELGGVVEATRLAGGRRALVLTLDQTDRLREDDVDVQVMPAWQWMG
jgi:predicted AAA+ superfamily ATPase